MEQVGAFIELVELDQRMANLTHQRVEGAAQKARLTQELARIDQEIDQADQAFKDTQKKIHEVELELKILDRSIARTQEKSLMANSQKELTSLEHEKEDLEKKRRVLDEQGLVLFEELEHAQGRAATLRADAPKLRHEKQKEIDAVSLQLERLETSLENCGGRREDLAKRVPIELMERYVSMKLLVPNPVVPIINDSCSGCFHSLNNTELSNARHGQLVTCKSCYRMLYITKVNT